MFQNILVPIDMAHLAEGKAILEMASEHAAEGAAITLLNVAEDIPTWAAAEIPRDVIERSIENATSELDAIAKSSGRKMKVEVRSGHAANTILEVAKEKNIDLIIVASHRPGLQDYFLGSTASKVVRHAQCSVMVVR